MNIGFLEGSLARIFAKQQNKLDETRMLSMSVIISSIDIMER
jgi:hypothetical protein